MYVSEVLCTFIQTFRVEIISGTSAFGTCIQEYVTEKYVRFIFLILTIMIVVNNKQRL